MRVPEWKPQAKFVRTHFPQVRENLGGKVLTKKLTPPQKSGRGFSPVIKTVLQVVVVISVLTAGVVLFPWFYYTFAPVETVPVAAQTDGSALGGEFSAQETRKVTLPPKDETLPQGSWISIPTIGVRTELRATEDPEEALRQGVWLAPQYGKPGDVTQPMIVVAHRFGYKVWWQDDYWKYNSFYYLPQTQPGDIVEVIHDQRKWVYEIYAGEEGEEITDYSADMILYTCKYLNSPIRHFRYARLVDTDL